MKSTIFGMVSKLSTILFFTVVYTIIDLSWPSTNERSSSLANVEELGVEFDQASASSLDLAILAKFKGNAAEH